jgi:hypothetical protein
MFAREVFARVVAQVVRNVARSEERVEILGPVVRPRDIEDAFVEALRAGVVRPVEHFDGRREAGAAHRAEQAIVIGEEQDAADIEQHCLRIGHPSKLPSSARSGWYRGSAWNSAGSMPFRRTRSRRSMR